MNGKPSIGDLNRADCHAVKPKRRLGVLVAIALMTLVTVLFAREYWFSRPTGVGPAGPSVDRQAFTSIWSDRKVHVLGLGDSVTAGLGADSPSHRYFNRVLRNPKDEFPELDGVCLTNVLPNLTSDNYAISGSESELHAELIRDSVPVHDEDTFGIVMMTSGGNDLIHMYGRAAPRECAMYGATLEQATPWIENFQTRLNVMIDRIISKYPGGCEIYLADIYDPTDGEGDAPSLYLPNWEDGLAIHARYNAAIETVAAERGNVYTVGLHEAFLGHGSHCRQWWKPNYCSEDPHYWFFSNVEDPNDRGYDAIRRVFLNTIASNTSLRTR